MHKDQPAPIPSNGDVWMELISHEPDEDLRQLYIERRWVGVERYGTPLQRGNGRDNKRDLREEMLDGMAYAQADGDLEAVAVLRRLLRDRAPRPAAR